MARGVFAFDSLSSELGPRPTANGKRQQRTASAEATRSHASTRPALRGTYQVGTALATFDCCFCGFQPSK